jgi:hypothetical protein
MVIISKLVEGNHYLVKTKTYMGDLYLDKTKKDRVSMKLIKKERNNPEPIFGQDWSPTYTLTFIKTDHDDAVIAPDNNNEIVLQNVPFDKELTPVESTATSSFLRFGGKKTRRKMKKRKPRKSRKARKSARKYKR